MRQQPKCGGKGRLPATKTAAHILTDSPAWTSCPGCPRCQKERLLKDVPSGARIVADAGPGEENLHGTTRGAAIDGLFEIEFDHEPDNPSYWPGDTVVREAKQTNGQ